MVNQQVTHNLNNNGFTTGLELEVKPPMWSTAQKKMRSEKANQNLKCNFEVYYSLRYASRGNNYEHCPLCQNAAHARTSRYLSTEQKNVITSART